MEQRINKLLEDHCYSSSEAETAIKFVQELLEDCANDLIENEPYAKTTINETKKAEYLVYGLLDIIKDNANKIEGGY